MGALPTITVGSPVIWAYERVADYVWIDAHLTIMVRSTVW
jgi:hypothetical protein